MRYFLRHHVLWLAILLIAFCGALYGTPSGATAGRSTSEDMTSASRVADVSVTAESFAVVDVASGSIVLRSPDVSERPIASVTKLFTAAALYDQTRFEGTTTITDADVATLGRAGKLEAGQVYPYHELVYALLLESSNDAGAAIARVHPTILTDMEGLSVTGTLHFSDTTGLSEGNRANAIDLAQAVRSLYLTEPHIFRITHQRELIGTYTGWSNNNPLLDMPGYRGGKHGYTEAAGRTVAAVFADETSEGLTERVYVLLGSNDLSSDTLQLREFIATLQ